jgi:4-carboxymuconolactone decarboxylase
MRNPDETFAAGLKIRNAMFGEAGAEHQIQDATDFTQPLQDLVTRYCFGEVWERPPLDRKIRSMLTLALLTALGRQTQLKLHVRGALQNGVSRDEIREVLLHSMIYAGVPAAVDSFLSAVEVFKQLGLEN